jgi:hypothetical protein
MVNILHELILKKAYYVSDVLIIKQHWSDVKKKHPGIHIRTKSNRLHMIHLR